MINGLNSDMFDPKNYDQTVPLIEESCGAYNVLGLEKDGTMVWAALMPLMFTTAIIFDISEISFEQRFCFQDKDMALRELQAWYDRGFNDVEPTGYIARRGKGAEEWLAKKEAEDRKKWDK